MRKMAFHSLLVLILAWAAVGALRVVPAWGGTSPGVLRLDLNMALLNDLGVVVPGANGRVAATVSGGPGFDVAAPDGRFAKLRGGYVLLRGFLKFAWPGGGLDIRHLRLVADGGDPPGLALADRQRRVWLRLQYGHFQVAGARLQADVADLVMGEAMAAAIGRHDLEGLVIGAAALDGAPLAPESDLQAGAGACTDPKWPTSPGADADIAMTRMEHVVQSARTGGRVVITPSAYFNNVGTADVPWLNMFATPERDPDHCFDDGNGACEPYGTDQGGKLVWALYRFADGRLEQLGRSAVKHAFNSVNFICPCSGGRIVWQGCADLYGVNTNENRDFLGPREELDAHGVRWDHRGSIFDTDGDDQCDVLEQDPFFGGQRCETAPQDELERRLHVAETDLSTPGARYFMETWYLVRDDVNIMNSFGRREVLPAFSSIWTFPFGGGFSQGPVLDDWSDYNAGAIQILESPVMTADGQLRLSSAVRRATDGQYQYDLTLMNFDFDPTITQLMIPIPSETHISEAEYFDGDGVPANDWLPVMAPDSVTWNAPEDAPLSWGALVSFRFRSGQPPDTAAATLAPGPSAEPGYLDAHVLVPAVFADGFEP